MMIRLFAGSLINLLQMIDQVMRDLGRILFVITAVTSLVLGLCILVVYCLAATLLTLVANLLSLKNK